MNPRDWSSNTVSQAARSARADAHDHTDTDHDDGWFADTPHDCPVPNPGQCLECALVVVWAQHKARTA